MIAGIGIDAVDIARIEGLISRGGTRFLDRVFTAAERAYCDARPRPGESYAARFAAKEAVMKCLATGWAEGLTFRQIEVVRDERGAVHVRLDGAAAQHGARLGIERVRLSLTHTANTATAFAIAER
ncbi:MAG: holo-ACP synthase [Planctomycetes bacterium]|nr:holo-ACP synthase [Planctomycetota bacterium]